MRDSLTDFLFGPYTFTITASVMDEQIPDTFDVEVTWKTESSYVVLRLSDKAYDEES